MNRRIANKLKKMAGVRDVTVQEAFDIVAKNLLQRDKGAAAIFFIDVHHNYKTNAKTLVAYTVFDKDMLVSREISLAEQCERSFEIDWTQGTKKSEGFDDMPWTDTEYDEEEEEEEDCINCGFHYAQPGDELCIDCRALQDEEDRQDKKHEEAEYRDMKI